MARVFKRGNMWGIDFTAHGKRIREIVAPNKAMAEIALKKKLVMIVENKFLDIKNQPKIRLNELADKYIEFYLKPNRPTWWKSEKHNIRHLLEFFGNIYLREITPMKIEEFRQDRLKQVSRCRVNKNPAVQLKYISKASVNKNVGCLRAMLNKAIEWGFLVGKNPAAGIKFYKVDNKRLRFLEKEDIKRLLGFCQGHLKDLVEFAINTGMRKGEIFNLKWHDVDYASGMIHILITKNGEKREIPMNESIKNILFRVKKHPDSPYVFASHTGKAFIDVKKSFNNALAKAGIKDFRWHDLRHTAASHLVMGGVDLNTVREILGHKSLALTLRYAHLSCDHKKRALKALDGLCGTNVAQPQYMAVEHSTIPSVFETSPSGL